MDRRTFLKNSGTAFGAAALPSSLGATALSSSLDAATPDGAPKQASAAGEMHGRIYTSIKFGMFGEKISIYEKFKLLKEMGYDGVELNSPGGVNKRNALAASREVGLPIHGVVDDIHWGVRLSDPDPEVRERGLQGLLKAIRDTHFVGGSAVLLVPGRVAHPEKENHQHVWDRSIEQINKALPTASKLGIHILIENVWNGFCYTHNGPDDQSAEQLAKYLDAIGSPWVGSYFDIGNHQKYGKPAEWIRTLGKRIVKLDVKDWGKKSGWAKVGDGDVDWADVRKALREIGFTGWATAEVGGGDRKRMKDVLDRMNAALGTTPPKK